MDLIFQAKEWKLSLSGQGFTSLCLRAPFSSSICNLRVKSHPLPVELGQCLQTENKNWGACYLVFICFFRIAFSLFKILAQNKRNGFKFFTCQGRVSPAKGRRVRLEPQGSGDGCFNVMSFTCALNNKCFQFLSDSSGEQKCGSFYQQRCSALSLRLSVSSLQRSQVCWDTQDIQVLGRTSSLSRT